MLHMYCTKQAGEDRQAWWTTQFSATYNAEAIHSGAAPLTPTSTSHVADEPGICSACYICNSRV
jgi:hypothetical protein